MISTPSRRPTRRLLLLLVAAAVAVFGLVGTGAASADHGTAKSPRPNPSFTPRSENDITNLDILRSQIKNYYGDPAGTGVASPGSNYAKEARRVEAQATRAITNHQGRSGKPALVLDVDDTSLLTWNFELATNWAFDPVKNADFVTRQAFPPVFGMPALAHFAKKRGLAIFFITGRPTTQEAATLGNLTRDGIGEDAAFPAPTTLPDGEDGLFTKPAIADYPDYLQQACAEEIAAGKACTTIHYKSATRQHIQSMGFDIVANMGDQFSDLDGGFADHAFKMPNPNYFLP